MDEVSITQYITDTFDGVDVVVASREAGSPEVAWGDTFFSYDPDRNLEPKHRFPFATIVTKDYGDFDCASQLNRPGVFRLNIGVSRETYRSLFGPQPPSAAAVACRGLRPGRQKAHQSTARKGVLMRRPARCLLQKKPPLPS